MQIHKRLPTIIIAIVTILAIALVHTFVLALAAHEIDAGASQTTVLIARQLDRKDSKTPADWETASGVIVARQGKTYYALTAMNVVKTPGVYGLRTSDDKMHVIDHRSQEGDNTNIRSLSLDEGKLTQQAQDLDLALVKFTSNGEHSVAPIGDSDELKQTDKLYVSGWPNPQDKSPRRRRITDTTSLSDTGGKAHTDGLHGIVYKVSTREPMDGAPVFNRKGQVVAIHRREKPNSEAKYCIASQLSANSNCGVPTAHIIRTHEADKLRLGIERTPINPKIIARGIKNKSKADTIPNVYKLFAFDLNAMLRNTPSLGCGSLLLGDKCPSQPK
jgi:hypothetical protein